jgi:peptide deformylase
MINFENKEIVKIGAKILINESKEYLNFNSDELKNIINLMFEAMHNAKGIGLAAPQINLPYKIFVYGFKTSDRYPTLCAVKDKVMINPTIIHYSDEISYMEEGCLSIPNLRGVAYRSQSIKVRYFDFNGIEHTENFSGIEATIIQHEYDHINGKFFLNRMRDLSTLRYSTC